MIFNIPNPQFNFLNWFLWVIDKEKHLSLQDADT